MNISFENVDKVSALLTLKVEKADYEEKVEKALKDFRKKANLPGFRPGQVPMGLLKKRFGTEILAEEINKILSHELYKYIREQKVNILGEPMANEEKTPAIDFASQEEFTFAFDIASENKRSLSTPRLSRTLLLIAILQSPPLSSPILISAMMASPCPTLT